MYHSRNVIQKITVSYHHEVITPKLLYHPKILFKGYHQQDILPKISPIKIMSQRGHTQNTNSKKALKDTVSIKKKSHRVGIPPRRQSPPCLGNGMLLKRQSGEILLWVNTSIMKEKI